MSALVVDASVAAKWFLREADAPAARALLGAGVDLKAPAVLRQEVSSAVVRAFRNTRLSRSDAEHALTEATQLLSSAAIELVASERFHTRAESIALDLRHSFLDCLYIALAERENCDLVTTDATFLSRAQPHFAFVKPL